jgi:hypothetical protein
MRKLTKKQTGGTTKKASGKYVDQGEVPASLKSVPNYKSDLRKQMDAHVLGLYKKTADKVIASKVQSKKTGGSIKKKK